MFLRLVSLPSWKISLDSLLFVGFMVLQWRLWYVVVVCGRCDC